MEIKIPKLSDAMTEGLLAAWLVADGALVRSGQAIYQLETDKVATDIDSPAAGTLQILKEPANFYPVGTVIGKLHSQFRRTESTRPVAPSANVTDETRFESPSGDKVFALPRYALVTDVVETIVEPRIAISAGSAVPVLSISFAKVPSAPPPVEGLAHVAAVRLVITVPVSDDPHGVREIVFPTAQFDASQQVLTAVLPLSTFGLREQLIAAFGSLEANATLIIARTISVAVPTGTTFPNGDKAYVNRDFVLETMVPPSPLILSERHRDRLAGN
jgi:Biotin-requiring enzyme